MTEIVEPDELDEGIAPDEEIESGYENPAQRWAEAPLLSRADMLRQIEQRKELDGRAVNLFRNALTQRPRSDLLEHYVLPNLYRPGSHHVYVTPAPRVLRLRIGGRRYPAGSGLPGIGFKY